MAKANKVSESAGAMVDGFPLPKGARPVPGNVAAEGEHTGHAHRVTGNGAVVYDLDDARYLHCPDGAEVSHEEHKTFGLPPVEGGYTVGRVLEYDHLGEESRVVRD